MVEQSVASVVDWFETNPPRAPVVIFPDHINRIGKTARAENVYVGSPVTFPSETVTYVRFEDETDAALFKLRFSDDFVEPSTTLLDVNGFFENPYD
jgi:hypothetical protein